MELRNKWEEFLDALCEEFKINKIVELLNKLLLKIVGGRYMIIDKLTKKYMERDIKFNRTKYGRVHSSFEDEQEKYFITKNGHFWLKLPNGYEISIFNGPGSYTDNYLNPLPNVANELEEVYSKYVKLAIIKDGYFCTRDFVRNNDNDVKGLVTSIELIEIINKVMNGDNCMARELHKKRNKELYALYSTITDSYVTGWLPKNAIAQIWLDEFIEKDKTKVKEYMKTVDKEVE